MSNTEEVPTSGDVPMESANMGGDGPAEETYTPHPMAGQGEDISPNKDGGVLKAVKLKGDEGEQDRPMKGDKVFVHYVGTLLNGKKFDSSRDRGEKFSFDLGKSQVIKAWDIGVATMKRGEIAVLTCKPEYAYGKNGQGQIPPNSTLVFEVELFDWKGEDISTDKDGGIIKRTMEAGDLDKHDTPNEDAVVDIHLTGFHEGRTFDDRDVKFTIGEGSDHGIVEGVEEGIQKMEKGEKAQLRLKPKYAFGAEGNKEFNIPADAQVQYHVHLKDFEQAKDTWEMDIEEKIKAGEECKEKGSAYFKSGNINGAVKKWKRIIFLLETESGLKEDEKKKSNSLQLAANLNLALAYLKTKEYAEAIKVCNTAFEFDANNEKGFFRRGQAYFGQTDFDVAKKDFEKVLELAPENKAAKNQITICNQKIKMQNEKEKRLYKNMFDTILKENRDKEEEIEQKKREMAENVKNFTIENEKKQGGGEGDEKMETEEDPKTEEVTNTGEGSSV